MPEPATVSVSAHFLAAAWVGVGGAIGALARYGTAEAVAKLAGRPAVVWATLLVNIAGCLIIGFVAARVMGEGKGQAWWLLTNRPLVVTGFCGALTTFSTFGFEVVDLAQRRGLAWAAGLVALHLCLGVGAVVLGQRLGA